jgi:hypothetical protein
MKNFNQFMSESVNISGDFNGTLNMGSPEPEQEKESFTADIVWEGKIYRLEIEGGMMSKNELSEQLQGEYPGAIVQNVYPASAPSKVKSAQRYRPERLGWTD